MSSPKNHASHDAESRAREPRQPGVTAGVRVEDASAWPALQNEQLQQILTTAAIGIVVIDRAGFIRFANPQAVAIFGRSPESLIGKNVGQMIPECDRTTCDAALKSCAESGESPIEYYNQLEQGLSADGSVFPMRLRAVPLSFDEEQFVGILEDVTEQKHAERELRRSEERFQLAMRGANDGLWDWDLGEESVYFSPRWKEMLGYEDHEIGTDAAAFFTRIHPEDRDKCQRALQNYLEGNSDKYEVTVRMKHKSGRDVVILARGFAVRDEDGQPVRVIGTHVDITERRHLEFQLAQAQKLESIGQLAAGIAHEINTPMQFIGDNTRFLEEVLGDLTPVLEKAKRLAQAVGEGKECSELSEEVKAALEQADVEYICAEIPGAIKQSLGGVERVRKIVRAMKNFSHPGGEEMTSIDLNQAVQSTITVATSEWKPVADMETKLDPALPPFRGLPGEINQVILNMIVNAAHAIADVVGDGSDGRGKITISTRQVNEFVELRIGDTGTGIPESARTKVFDPFFTTKEVGKGSGQGLSISHNVIVKKHGGTLEFETEAGKGTTFFVRLPLKSDG